MAHPALVLPWPLLVGDNAAVNEQQNWGDGDSEGPSGGDFLPLPEDSLDRSEGSEDHDPFGSNPMDDPAEDIAGRSESNSEDGSTGRPSARPEVEPLVDDSPQSEKQLTPTMEPSYDDFAMELQQALADFAPDLRLLDSSLILGADEHPASEPEGDHNFSAAEAVENPHDQSGLGDLVVDWVAIDSKGRLNLVVWLGSDARSLPGEPVDIALEMLHRVNEQFPYIQRHLGSEGIRREFPPRLILIATHFLDVTVRKLSVLGGERVRLLEVHEVRSQSGSSHHLVARWPLAEDSEVVGPDEFLDHLHSDLRPLAESLIQRLEHVDERVMMIGSGDSALEWNLLNQPLCWLEKSAQGLNGRIGGGLAVPLLDEGSANAFLENVLRHYFVMLEADPEREAEPKTALVDQGMGLVLSSDEMDAFL